jgi:hypothetical protein
MLEYFESGRSVIVPDKVTAASEIDIPFLFENAEISIVNLCRLTDSILMPSEANANGNRKYEFWLQDDFYRVIRSQAPSPYRAVTCSKILWPSSLI